MFQLAEMVSGKSVEPTKRGRASRESSSEAGSAADEAFTGGRRSKNGESGSRGGKRGTNSRIRGIIAWAKCVEQLRVEFEMRGSRDPTFDETAGRPRFPPSEEAAQSRSAYISAGRAAHRYLPRLGAACVLLGYGLRWGTRAVAQSAKGLARRGDRIRAPNPGVSCAVSAKTLRGITGQMNFSRRYGPAGRSYAAFSRGAFRWYDRRLARKWAEIHSPNPQLRLEYRRGSL